MKRQSIEIPFLFFLLFCLVSTTPLFAHKRDSLNTKSLEFVANRGQWEKDILYKAKISNGALFFQQNSIRVVVLNHQQLESFYNTKTQPDREHSGYIDASYYNIFFEGANEQAQIKPFSPSASYHNYFIGNNKSRWTSHVPLYHELQYKELYPGIDLRYYQQNQHLKYEFIVAPNANPQQIKMRYKGAEALTINQGNLIIKTAVGNVLEMKPYAYQIQANGDTLHVQCEFVQKNGIVSYKLKNYDTKLALIIDPVLVFSSYSGSAADNWGYTATYDKHGNLYGGGIAFGIGYPTDVVPHHYQIDFAGGSCDVSISKFDSSGSFLHYSTYLGGTQAECPHSLYVNDNDELYVFGTTGSVTFPYTSQAYDTTFNFGENVTVNNTIRFPFGTDIFVCKFSADGDSLLASTFVGGSDNDGLNLSAPLRKNYADESRGEIIVDEQSNVYIASCTYSTDFPVTFQGFQTQNNGGKDGCIFKMDQNLSHLIWSSYIGGSGEDACYSLDRASDNSIYVCGGTTSSDLDVSSDAYQNQYGGGVCDGFVAHISENGNHLQQLSYIGKGDYDQCYLVKLASNNHPYLFGQTNTQGSSWIINASYGQPSSGQFITQLTPTLDDVVWSTVYGTGSGQPDISPTALLVDLCNSIYMSGWGSEQLNGFGGTAGLPITADAYQHTTDGSDYYFICLSDDGSNLVYASYFGSPNSREHVDGGTSRFDRKGRIYQAICAGCGGDDAFPTTPGAWSETNGSYNCNLGVVKMDFKLPVIVADFMAFPNIACYPDSISFSNQSQSFSDNSHFYWDFGDGSHTTDVSPSHQYQNGGLYTVTLYISDTSSCNQTDSISKKVLVLSGNTQILEEKQICYSDFTQIGIAPSGIAGVNYQWSPSSSLSSDNISNPIAMPDTTTTYRLIITTPYCSDTLYQTVYVEHLVIGDLNDTTICLGQSTQLSFNILQGQVQHIVWSLHPDFSDPIAENVQSITVSPTEDTHYYIQITGIHGCTLSEEITVSISSVSIETPETQRICFEDSIQLQLQVSGGNNLHYQWTPEEGILSGAETGNPWVNPSQSTTYYVTVTNEFGCTATSSISVIKRIGTFDQGFEAWCDLCEIIEGTSSQVFSTVYGNGYTYQWTPAGSVAQPNSPNSTVTPNETTTYVASLTDEFGCTLSKEVKIEVSPMQCGEPLVFIPNSFTPNGDGKNDILYVRSTILKEFTLRIYDRWGELIFETQDLQQGWDGTYKGKYCAQGVYDYYFKGTCVNDEEFIKKGNVTIIY